MADFITIPLYIAKVESDTREMCNVVAQIEL